MVEPAPRPPSVDRLARSLAASGLPHALLVDLARRAVATGTHADPDRLLAELRRSVLQPVINATGVLLHTNLGRAPLGAHQRATATNLELDLDTGSRGSRNDHAARLLALAAGAEAGLVVNNGAAAVLLSLAAVAGPGGRVAVSRGELIEIGGGFRLPEVMAQAGVELVEVGTTNRTRTDDYAAAHAAEPLAAVLSVHRSNFDQRGFTESPRVADLARVGPPLLADLGSGLLDERCPWLPGGAPPWLAGEPAARQTLARGAGLVVCSGDKLLGGPQAGLILGRRELVDRCARHPLARAVRAGGLVLGALGDVALAYLAGDASTIPFWAMATAEVTDLEGRAKQLAAAVSGAEAIATEAVTGGGTLPGRTIPSAGVALRGDRRAELRRGRPPVIARVRDGRTVCDLRTVDPDDDEQLAAALQAAGDHHP